MADDDLCEFSDLPRYSCSHCTQQDKPKPEPAQRRPSGFRRIETFDKIAEFDSECPACGGDILGGIDAIVPNEEVRPLGVGQVKVAAGWRHKKCP